jgi:hypothetical protein
MVHGGLIKQGHFEGDRLAGLEWSDTVWTEMENMETKDGCFTSFA